MKYSGKDNSTNQGFKKATKKFFIYFLAITILFVIGMTLIEVLGFIIATFSTINIVFKITLASCYVVAFVLMFIFVKKRKKIALVLWTIIAASIYIGYAILLFPQKFMENLYFPKEAFVGYMISLGICIFCYMLSIREAQKNLTQKLTNLQAQLKKTEAQSISSTKK